jgi:REP element-mobilizing transposase RayT
MSDLRNRVAAIMRGGQPSFEFRTWGGRRGGAGRKAILGRPSMPHRTREEFRPYQPVHVTVRMAPWVWNLRSQRSSVVIHGAFDEVREHRDVRFVEYTILGNHLHAIVEASGRRALSDAMRALSIRLAHRLNAMMGRKGPVLEDRYHVHVLRTPAEVHRALQYVRGNFASHAARRGAPLPAAWVDPYSSVSAATPRFAQGSLWPEPVTQPAATWLLRKAGAGAR